MKIKFLTGVDDILTKDELRDKIFSNDWLKNTNIDWKYEIKCERLRYIYCQRCDTNYVMMKQPQLRIVENFKSVGNKEITDGFDNEREIIRNLEYCDYDKWTKYVDNNLISIKCPVCGFDIYNFLGINLINDEERDAIFYEKKFLLEPYCNELTYRIKGFDKKGSGSPTICPNRLLLIMDNKESNAFCKLLENEIGYEGAVSENYEKYYNDLKNKVAEKATNASINDIKENLIINPIKIDSNRVDTIKESVEELSEYIHNGIEIEKNIYILKERLSNLIVKSIDSNCRGLIAKTLLSDSIKEVRLAAIQEYDVAFKRVDDKKPEDYGLQKKLLPFAPIKPKLITIEDAPLEPEYKKPGLFNKKKVLEYNDKLKSEYENECRRYEEKNSEIEKLNNDNNDRYNEQMIEWKEEYDSVEKYNNQIMLEVDEKKENERKALNEEKKLKIAEIDENSEFYTHPDIEENKMVVDEIEEAKKSLSQLLSFRNQYFSPNIIFPKYTSLSALATMYEYFQTGRCTELAGPGGAYNLYESELRSNIIIEKLDEIIMKLNEIQASQYTLVSIMNSVSNSLRSIDGKMTKACEALNSIDKSTKLITKNTNAISENTAIAAYNIEKISFYSKVNATVNLARFLGF